ncbi:hypothetical protein TNCT_277981 [Trichonephila clavata]|uniref:Uncharacterized protein n=1 Tax=Trichonephila clavata TaxID=2740835 RepID=A0A8X6IB68_TRICU|nr:hypothetical protein TNCT_277981 [Trichonephila clavata]
MVDASDNAIGFCRYMSVITYWKPLAFFFIGLTSTQKRYSDFLHDSKLASPSSFVQQYRSTFTDLRYVLPSHHTKQKSFIFRDLAMCTHVFVRTDSVRTSLQPPYKGANPVIKGYSNCFDINIKGVSRTISID